MDTNHSTSHTPNPHKRTRKCSETEHDPIDWESENDPIVWDFENENFPPNIVVAPRPSSSPCLSNLSPIAIGRQLKEQKINPLKVTKNSNRLNIRVSNAKDCNNLLKLKTFCGIEVKIEPHATLNNSKGVIKNNELKYCTIEEMESMKGITDAHQIIRTENGKEIKTGTWFLTFDRPICPKFIDIEYLKNIPVLPYIPKPMKCHNCQRFGHTQKNDAKEMHDAVNVAKLHTKKNATKKLTVQTAKKMDTQPSQQNVPYMGNSRKFSNSKQKMEVLSKRPKKPFAKEIPDTGISFCNQINSITKKPKTTLNTHKLNRNNKSKLRKLTPQNLIQISLNIENHSNQTSSIPLTKPPKPLKLTKSSKTTSK